ncbi:hypothetical protein G3M48_008011 [Beauveria asiatica]|uniref:Uncharacterized protein n=1 Tax=Beauveria asiatica TaxID=1069075 RepID=A0AAW0S3F4_9HYPO
MPSQEQMPQQQQPMAATNPAVEAARPSSEQPRPVEPMSVGLRGGHNGEGENAARFVVAQPGGPCQRIAHRLE